MKKGLLVLLFLIIGQLQGYTLMNTNRDVKAGHRGPVHKKVISNGMTVLVRPVHMVPKVSVQLWYNVGSKDERDQERGIAHLIEHMIFKGTDTLSESDIDSTARKLSGSLNAFTSYDYTGYLFNFPSQNWHESFNIMSDCMRNCSFKEYMLNSEMKAVIQELKMYRDKYDRSLVDELISSIFQDHPYHHPIIGYKQDLWSVSSDGLKSFYKKHYVPNNATMVVVGDVDPEDVFARAEEQFGSIPADPSYKKADFYFNKDIASKSVTLYRDIKQPLAVFTFVVPGIRSEKDNILELLSRIVGRGRSSRLYKRLVNEEQLAVSLSASSEELFDHGLFFIVLEPKRVEDIPKIERIINQELDHLKVEGISDVELVRAIKKTEMALHSLMEDMEHQAYEIGKYYLATNDENYLFEYLNKPIDVIKKEMKNILMEYIRPSVMHKGFVLPLPESEKAAWVQLQKESDAEDERILKARKREEPIEKPRYANNVKINDPKAFNYPKPGVIELKNGLKILSYNNENTPKIDLILDLKTKHYADPSNKQGLTLFMSKMLLEGTKKYSSQELAEAIEDRGMSISAYPGGIAMSVLRDDFEYGIELLNEILTNATIDEKEVEKVRHQLLSKLKNFWDEPRYFAGQIIKEQLYKGHPYSKNSLGDTDTIKNITAQELRDYYKKVISPDGARLAIVGDFKGQDIVSTLEKQLSGWVGEKISNQTFPELIDSPAAVVDYPINRDQVVLRFAGRSINRLHPDFDKLFLFDQIFGGGALGSMSSRLFKLREQSGLFYTIGGSLVAGADEEPGLLLVQTIVSLDRLDEAEKAIRNTILTAADTISQEEFDEAKRAIINVQVDNFVSNYNIANAFLFLDRYKFSSDFFDTRAERLAKLSIDETKSAAKNILKKQLLTLRVGRVQKETAA